MSTLDTGANCNIMSYETGCKIGKPSLVETQVYAISFDARVVEIKGVVRL